MCYVNTRQIWTNQTANIYYTYNHANTSARKQGKNGAVPELLPNKGVSTCGLELLYKTVHWYHRHGHKINILVLLMPNQNSL
jgi:hypothetical protein